MMHGTEERPRVELLAPVGNPEKLEVAIHYGADAVYLAGKMFNLRNYSGNFTPEELQWAVRFGQERGVNIYVACNIYARDKDFQDLPEYLKRLGRIGPDAIIIADPGVLALAQSIVPHIPLHLSTQANTTNLESARFWAQNGIRRINAARELSIDEIEALTTGGSMEVEAFVHGAMCMAYSGRCHLSSFMTSREGNRGECTHPCRWRYAVVEEMRPGSYMPVSGDDRGTYLFHAHDLCMVEHLPRLIEAGLRALKIEGRMKGIHYLSSVVKTYREAIDTYYADPMGFRLKDRWIKELQRTNNRGFCSGFYLGSPNSVLPAFERQWALPEHLFIGKVTAPTSGGLTQVQVRNKFYQSEEIEVLTNNGAPRKETIRDILDESGTLLDFAQPGSHVAIRLRHRYAPLDLIRRRDVPT